MELSTIPPCHRPKRACRIVLKFEVRESRIPRLARHPLQNRFVWLHHRYPLRAADLY